MKGGVILARLPKMISRRINFQFDLHEIGFPKLKALLSTLDNVIVENDGTTYACAVLNK